MNASLRSRISSEVRKSFEPVLAALPGVQASLGKSAGVALVRAGYFYPDTGAPVPAIVIAVFPGTPPDAIKIHELSARFNVPISITPASIDEQQAAIESVSHALAFAPDSAPAGGLASLLRKADRPLAFLAPRTGAYEPMDPPDLPEIKARMTVTICVSPEAGWNPLKTFLEGTTERLTVAMYQFTAPHIFDAVKAAVEPAGRKLELVLHPVPEPPSPGGVKASDLDERKDVLQPLEDSMADRFEFSWATLRSKASPDGLWASAYHIKVAVRDGNTIWLSSGNWQSSNQPNVDPFANPESVPAGFQGKYNRDYHAIVENTQLATIFEKYIHRDYTLTKAVGSLQSFDIGDVFVPDEDETADMVSFAAPPQYFQPLQLDREIRVQPLLTPDNYAEFVLKLIQSAKTKIWFQNQYITFRDDGEDFPEFQALVCALKDKIDAGLEVRIICRDMMKESSLDILIAMGFPREVIRFQKACHNKTIIVDEETVMFGSQNWSNEGVKPNRDASLIFHDPEIARYLAGVHAYDWERRASAKPAPTRARVARANEPTPRGMRRVPASTVEED